MMAINSQLWNLEDIKRFGVERYSKEESDTALLITDPIFLGSVTPCRQTKLIFFSL